jgi:hypothetical protein
MEPKPAEAEEVRAVWRVDRTQVAGCASSVAYMHCSAADGRFVIALILPFRTGGVNS